MPLSDSDLSSKLQTFIGSVIDLNDPAQLKRVCDAIASAVVSEITSNALVTGQVTGGVAAGDPVTGTVS